MAAPEYLIVCALFVVAAVLNHRNRNHAAGGMFMLAAAIFLVIATKGA